MEKGPNTGSGYLDGVVSEGLSQEDTSRLSGGGTGCGEHIAGRGNSLPGTQRQEGAWRDVRAERGRCTWRSDSWRKEVSGLEAVARDWILLYVYMERFQAGE